MSIDNFFVERRNQFQKSTLQKLFRGNPFRSLVPMSAYDLSEGRTPTVRTLTHELPTAYPVLTEVGVSDGGGSQPCAPAATTIKRGEIQRTFKLSQTSFRTDVLCLSDLKRAEQAADAVAGFERALNEYINVWWGDWYRVQNIAQVDNKVATKASSQLDVSINNSDVDHHSLGSLPDADLNWDHLKQLYWQLCRNGLADELAIGRDSKGRPILPLHAGPGIISALWKDDTNSKEQVKFFDSAKNLQALGYDGAINGFLPVVDLFPIRYGKGTAADQSDNVTGVAQLTTANMVYPTVNAGASTGRRYTNNGAYAKSVAGVATGRAKYEVVTILGRDVYEAKFESVDATQFGGAKFEPQSYVGEFQWINNRTFEGGNDRGNLGYYLADIRCGARPLFPELGYSILTLARDICPLL
jgi:hypothetical protein